MLDELAHADVELPEVGLDTGRALLRQEILLRADHEGPARGEVTQHRDLGAESERVSHTAEQGAALSAGNG